MKKQETESNKPLRHGYTTGANATAATKAALLSLLEQTKVLEASIKLPIGEVVSFQMESIELTATSATASVIKDGGDDPDATHGARIVSSVSFNKTGEIRLDGGVGVGRVTKPGLPVAVGEAAINPVPKKMIIETVQAIVDEYGLNEGLDVIISVPDGEEIAKKTLNGRLGIIGGISILGTRGTVIPFSTSAYKASIVQAISVAVENGCSHLFLTTGGRSEKYAMELYPNEPEEAFIEMGDFVGFSVKLCKAKKQIKKITLVGMMGKFSKVAQGVMMVHSKSAPVSFEFLAEVAKDAGAPEELLEEIRQANTAAQVGTMMQEIGCQAFFTLLCKYVSTESIKAAKVKVDIETIIMSMKNEVLGRETVRWEDLSKSSE